MTHALKHRQPHSLAAEAAPAAEAEAAEAPGTSWASGTGDLGIGRVHTMNQSRISNSRQVVCSGYHHRVVILVRVMRLVAVMSATVVV